MLPNKCFSEVLGNVCKSVDTNTEASLANGKEKSFCKSGCELFTNSLAIKPIVRAEDQHVPSDEHDLLKSMKPQIFV